MTEFILQTAAGVDYRLAPSLDFSLSYGLGTPCDAFSVTCPWVAGQEGLLAGLVRLRALRAGAVIFVGVIDEWECSLSARGYLLTLTGRGMQARLLDNEALSADFGVATLADVMHAYVTPHGIALTQEGALPAVRGFSVKAGSSCWQVLHDFVRYHGGVLPRFDARGGLSLAPLPTALARVLGDDLPVSALCLRHRRYGVFSQVQVQNRTTRRVESVRNVGFAAEGGSATRVLTVPRNTDLQSMRHSAQFQLAQSQRLRICVELCVPQLLLLAPGDLVELRRTGFGANGAYRVLELTLSFGERGYETTLVLGDTRYAM